MRLNNLEVNYRPSSKKLANSMTKKGIAGPKEAPPPLLHLTLPRLQTLVVHPPNSSHDITNTVKLATIEKSIDEAITDQMIADAATVFSEN